MSREVLESPRVGLGARGYSRVLVRLRRGSKEVSHRIGQCTFYIPRFYIERSYIRLRFLPLLYASKDTQKDI